MNLNIEETKILLKDIKEKSTSIDKDINLIIAPSFTYLYPAKEILKETDIILAAQDVHQEEEGAYTGEVSASMLESIGVKTVILGHSERRKYQGETKAVLNKKANTALKSGFDVIFCVGESLNQREKDIIFKFMKDKLEKRL